MKFNLRTPLSLPAVAVLPQSSVFTTLTDLLDRILQILLVFGGGVVVLMIAYSALLFMTAGADPTRRGRAKSVLLWTVVGYTVIVLSWIIITTVAGFFGASIEKP